jgi:lysozyme family protein
MRDNFTRSVNILFELEGYGSNDPLDKGGLTRYGIAQKYHPDIDVSKLTAVKAAEVYLKEYWIPAGCDELEYPTDMVMFIQCVNIGVAKARKYMQESKGLLDFFMLNLQHYSSREKAQRDRFLTGWCNRLISVWRNI